MLIASLLQWNLYGEGARFFFPLLSSALVGVHRGKPPKNLPG